MSISVLIPCRGNAPYLCETLDSVFKSSLPPSEVIVVNDGMSMQALDRLNTYKNRQELLLLDNKMNGLVSALNLGVKSSKNEFVARIDDDDLMETNRLLVQSEFLRSHQQVVVAGSQLLYIDESGATTGHSNYPVGRLNEFSEFHRRCLVAHPSVMMRKSAVLAIGGYRSMFKWNGNDLGEDFDLWLRLSNLGEIFNIDLSLTRYRQHSSQSSVRMKDGHRLATYWIVSMNVQNPKNQIQVAFEDGKCQDIKLFKKFINKTFSLPYRVNIYAELFYLSRKKPTRRMIFLRYFLTFLTSIVRHTKSWLARIAK